MAIDALTTMRARDRIEPANQDGHPGRLSRRTCRGRWLSCALNVYVQFMATTLGLIMFGAVLMLLFEGAGRGVDGGIGWSHKLLGGLMAAFGHPAILAARLADLMAGPPPILGRSESEASWDRAWNITFSLALAPDVVALRVVSWRRCRTGGWSPAVLLPVNVAEISVSAVGPFESGG